MSKQAPRDGVYTLDGHRYVIAGGDELPKGAVFEGEDAAKESDQVTEERKQGPAPENKSQGSAPENRSAAPAPEKKTAKPAPEKKSN